MSLHNIYTGRRTDAGPVVSVNDRRLPGPANEFDWGYHGSGCAALARAILTYEYGAGYAEAYYQDFKRLLIGNLPEHRWRLDSEAIADCISNIVSKTPSA